MYLEILVGGPHVKFSHCKTKCNRTKNSKETQGNFWGWGISLLPWYNDFTAISMCTKSPNCIH